MINLNILIKQLKRCPVIINALPLIFLMEQYSPIAINFSTTQVKAEETINFTPINQTIRGYKSRNEKPLQLVVKDTIDITAIKNKIVWSINTPPHTTTQDTENSKIQSSLKWKVLSVSEIKVISNIPFNSNHSLGIEALIPVPPTLE